MKKLLEEYNRFIELLYRLRNESIDDPESFKKYNEILESKEFQNLENLLIKECNKSTKI